MTGTMRKRLKVEPARRKNGPARCSRARHWRIQPDLDRPFYVDLFISPTRKHMLKTIENMSAKGYVERTGMRGMVRGYSSRVNRNSTRRRPQMVRATILATMWLNAVDLQWDGNEIIAHECTHAGMRWAELQRANLKTMDGEEVLCYATGRMMRQVARICHAMSVW